MRRGFGYFGQSANLKRVVCWSVASVCTPGLAFAQATPAPPAEPLPVEPAPAPATPPATAPTAPVVSPTEPTQPEPVVEPVAQTPVPEPEAAPPPQPTVVPPPVEPIRLEPPVEAAPPPAAEESRWYDRLTASAFLDSYFGLNYQTPKPQQGRNRFRAYDTANGFALGVAGLDVAFNGEHFGGTVALRFGPTAQAIAGDDSSLGLEPVKQAYATWRPGGDAGALTLDFGKFDTIYGAEVAESQFNYNYTRGLVNWLAQPLFHTGLRATVEFSPQFWMTALAVNGWNNSYDNNLMKSFGLQLSTSMPNAADPDGPALMDAHIGYLVGPEQADFGFKSCGAGGLTFDPAARNCSTEFPENSADIARDADGSNSPEAFRHLIDVIVGFNPSRNFSLLLNGDIGFEGVREGGLSDEELGGFENQMWWGVAAMGRYQLDPEWALAIRGEIYGDPDGRATAGDDPYVQNVEDLQIYSATLTLEYVPVANLILRLDNRFDFANEDVFPEQLRSYGALQATSTLGVVVTSD